MHEIAQDLVVLTPVPFVNCVAVRGGNGWTLVDAGLGLTAPLLLRQLRRLGIRRGDLERIVLTHAHLDHAGGAAAVRDALGAAEVLVGPDDVDFVRVGRNPPGPVPGLPGYRAVPTAGAAVLDTPLGDTRRMVLVATPGHTPGHVAVHLPADDVVLGGDAVFNVFRLAPAPDFLCSDVPASQASLQTLADLDPATLVLAHGGAVTDDPTGRLRELLATD